MYCSGYPIIHTVNTDSTGKGEYKIELDGDEIYSGVVYSKDNNAGSVEVDLSPIFRQFLDVNLEDFANLSGTADKAVKTFSVDGASYEVCYNYNTEYILEMNAGDNLNLPVAVYVDPRQYIGTSVLGSGGIIVSHSKPVGSPGAKITLGGYEYIISNPCRNRFAIYYVNNIGGLDYLLAAGRTIEKYSSEKIDGKLYADMSNRLAFSSTRINQFITRGYQLNTGLILSDERMSRINNLTHSPKIWVHDLEKDTITACLCSDSSVTVRNYRNDKIVGYDINLVESKQYIRK